MATISGELIFSITRNNQTDSNSYGIGNIPIVLQNTTTNEILGVFTESDGSYTFTQVPDGSYRIVLVYEYEGKTLNSPAAFTSTNTEVGNVPSAKLPPYTVLTGYYPTQTTNLSAVTPTTVFVTISNDEDVTAQTIFLGPTRYEPIKLLLDSSAIISPRNLLQAIDNGTFGEEPPGTEPNGGPAINPYPNITDGFTFIQQKFPIRDGYYSIGNTIAPYPEFLWWRLSDRTTGIETGRMEIVNGAFSGKSFLNLRENVEPFTNYVFSAWLVNVDNSTYQQAPKFGIKITGDSPTDVLYNEDLGDYFSPTQNVLPIWKEVGTAFNSENNTSVGLTFYSLGEAASGNDYAVDDVELRLIIYPVVLPTKTVNTTYATLDEIITYTIVVDNTNDNSLINVSIVDKLSDNLEFVQGSVTINNETDLTENPNDGFIIPEVKGQTTTTVTFQAKVISLPSNTMIDNVATLDYDYTPIIGGIPNSFSEESESVSLYVGKAVIGGEVEPNSSFTKSVNEQYAKVGDVLTYTIVAENIGNVEATNVVIVDNIPEGTTYVDNSISSNVDFSGSPLTTINLTNPLLSNEKAIITYQVKVDQIPSTNPIPNSAKITFNYTENPDEVNKATGSGTTNTVNTFVVNPTISIVKSENITEAIVGDIVTYTLVVENTGNIDYTNVIVTDDLQVQSTFVSGSLTINNEPSDENISNGIVIGTLGIGEKAIITFKAKINSVPTTNIINNNGKVEYTVVTGTTSTNYSETSNTVEIKVYNIPNLVITKTSSDENVYVGNKFTYTINVKNVGDVNISNIVISDLLPSQFIITNIKINDKNANTTELNNLNIGTIGPNESDNIVITILVVANTLSNFQNQVSAKGSVQVNNANPPIQVTDSTTSDVSVTTVEPAPSVSIVKSENITEAIVGDVVTYTLDVENTGNIDVTNVVVTDELQSELTFVTGSLTINNEPSDENILKGVEIGTLAIGEKATLTFKSEISKLPQSNIINNNGKVEYTVITDLETTNYNETSNTVEIKVFTPSLSVTKTSSDEDVYVGNKFTYTINVKNTGNVNVSNIIISDLLPPQFEITKIEINNVNYTTTKLDGLNIGNLQPNESDNIVVTILVLSNTLSNFINEVSASGTAQVNEFNQPTKISASAISNQSITTIEPEPSISIVKSENITEAIVGNIVTYTLEVQNTGNIDITNVVITDEFQSELTFVEGSLTINNELSEENILNGVEIETLKIGEKVTITFKAKVNAEPLSNIIYNNGKVDYTVITDSSTTNYSETSNTVEIKVFTPSLSITKTSSNEDVYVGNKFTYTINVKNTGDVNVSNIIISDVLPFQFKITKIEINNVNYNTTELDGLNIGNLQPNESDNIVVTILVLSNTLSNFINTVSASGTSQVNEVNSPTQVSASTTSQQSITTVEPEPSVSIVKSENITEAIVGNVVTYTLDVENTGNIDVTNVVVIDELQSELTFVEGSLTINNEPSDENILNGVGIGTLAIGEKATITFKAEVNAEPPSNIIYNNGKVDYKVVTDSSTTDYNEISNTVEIKVFMPSLSVTKTSSAENVYVGEEFTYTINVKNTGEINISDIIISDSLPPQFEIIKIEINNVNINTTELDNLNIGTLTPNESKIIVVTILVLSNTLSNFINKVSVSGTSQVNEVNSPTKISASATSNQSVTTIEPEPSVSIVKSENITKAIVGNIVTYTLDVENTGNINVTNVVVTDELQSQLTFVEGSLTINNEPSDENISNGVSIGTLAIGEKATITFKAQVNGELTTNLIENSAGVNYTVVINSTITNYSETSNVVQLQVYDVSLEVTKTSSAENVYVGEEFTYTINIKNTGEITVSNIIISDMLPSKFKITKIEINNTNANTTVLDGLNIGNLQPNESDNIVVTILVLSNTLSNFVNEVSASGTAQVNEANQPTPVTSSASSDKSVTTIEPSPSLSIIKSQDVNTVFVGETVTYTLVVKNTGNITLSNLVVSDDLSQQLIFVKDSITINGTQSTGDIINSINIGNLNINQEITITFQAIANSNSPSQTIENYGKITYDVVLANTTTYSKQSNVVELLVETTEILVTKESNRQDIYVGETFTYTITLQNLGNIPISNVILNDELPKQLTVVNITVNGEENSSTQLDGLNVGTLNVNETITVVVTIKVTENNLTNFKNTVVATGTVQSNPNNPPQTVGGTGTDSNFINTIKPITTLSIEKSQSTDIATAGEIITYTLTLKNTGNVNYSNLVVIDNLSPKLTFIKDSVILNGKSSTEDITTGVNIATLNVGESAVITFNARVNNICYDFKIENNATVLYNVEFNDGTMKLSSVSNTVSLEVKKSPLKLSQKTDKDCVCVWDELTYQIFIKNSNDISIGSKDCPVILHVNLPPNVAYVLGSLTININNIKTDNLPSEIDLGVISPYSFTIVTFKVRVLSCDFNPIKNKVSISYCDLDYAGNMTTYKIESNETCTFIE